jgi:hypothetical protein
MLSTSFLFVLWGLTDQPQVRLVNQGGGLKRLARLLLRHLPGREFTKLIVDQRQKLSSGVRVALLNGVENMQDIGHNCKPLRLERHPRDGS